MVNMLMYRPDEVLVIVEKNFEEKVEKEWQFADDYRYQTISEFVSGISLTSSNVFSRKQKIPDKIAIGYDEIDLKNLIEGKSEYNDIDNYPYYYIHISYYKNNMIKVIADMIYEAGSHISSPKIYKIEISKGKSHFAFFDELGYRIFGFFLDYVNENEIKS